MPNWSIFDWFVTLVPDFWIGVALATMSLVLFIWATSAVVSAYDACGHPLLKIWHPRRWFATCFPFWFGMMMYGLSVICGYLGAVVLLDERGTPLWGAILCGSTGVFSILAFRDWIIERAPEKGL